MFIVTHSVEQEFQTPEEALAAVTPATTSIVEKYQNGESNLSVHNLREMVERNKEQTQLAE